MKKIILFITISLLLSSCSSTYFFSTLNSSDQYTKKAENGDFLYENDSLWIAYCFYGENAPIQITVYNKTNKPLFVDWQRSALIIDDQAISYTGNTAQLDVTSNSTSTTFHYPNIGLSDSYSKNNISGSVNIPQSVSFIPPRTKISNNSLSLNIGFQNIDKKAYKKATLADSNEQPLEVRKITFNEENTPLRFTSYLTIYTEPEKPMVYEQDFYIANLIRANGLSPNHLPQSMANRGDLFFVEKPANNTFWQVLLGTTIVAGAIVIDASLNNGNSYHNNYFYNY